MLIQERMCVIWLSSSVSAESADWRLVQPELVGLNGIRRKCENALAKVDLVIENTVDTWGCHDHGVDSRYVWHGRTVELEGCFEMTSLKRGGESRPGASTPRPKIRKSISKSS